MRTRSSLSLLAAALTLGCGAGEMNLLQGEESDTAGQTLGTQVVLTPVEDARVESASSGSNYGTSSRLLVDGSPQMESYLKFDLSGVTGTVTAARLRLYAFNGTTGGPSVYATTSNWAETQLTWSNRPARQGSAVATAATVTKDSWMDVDVTAAVTAGTLVSLVVAPNSGDGVDFYSRTGSRPPELVVTTSGSGSTPDAGTADTQAPTVAITSPTNGASYSSATTVNVAVQTSDNVGVQKVEFFDNGVWMGTEDTSPFALTWTVDASQNGSHSWTARAFDAAGNFTTSAAVNVTVSITAAPDAGTPDTGGGAIVATVETLPVPHSGDAADDAAVWVHPTNPALSTIIGTDKLGGLAVYDLAGNQLHYYADGSHNNVDIRYGFPLNGQLVTLVVSSETVGDSLRIYTVDPATRGLVHVSARTISVGIGIYGLCMYKSPLNGKFYVFDSDSSGTTQQWELFESSGKVDAKKVRTLTLSSTTEGCVADDDLGALYISQEDVGIWRYDAEPTGGTTRTQVDAIANGHLTADIEGLSIYYGSGTTGYLIASSQGANQYAVYRRDGNNAWVMNFAVAAGSIDAVTYTDGIDVASFNLGPSFPEGVFIAQDDKNDTGNQNYKLVPWGSIARSASPDLLIDSTRDPRVAGSSTPPPPTTTDGGTSGTTDAGTPGPVDAGTPDAGSTPPPGGVTFYVDSISGNDANSGTTQSSAWKTLSKADSATLAPGDHLLFRRGGSWTGTLTVNANGTASAPVVVGAYGTGAAPIITGASTCIALGGSYVTLQSLHAKDCTWAGVNVTGSFNRIEDMDITGNAAGVVIKPGANDNRVLNNRLIDNNRMSVLTEGGSDDSGAFGILLRGDRTEVAWNLIQGCDAFSYDYGRDGAAVEIYGAQFSHVHHNLAIDNDAFTELGDARSADNTFAFNVVRSSLTSSVFAVTRGANSSYGPVLRTTLYNNTVRLTGSSSQGFVCHAGCGPNILVMRNNVIEAGWKVGYADAPFDEDRGVYYLGQRQFTMGPNSVAANPMFVDPVSGNLRLLPGSPAIDTGTPVGYSVDRDGLPVPADGNADGVSTPDRGAHERQP